MKRYDPRPRWKTAVLQTGRLSPVTKLVMFVLHDHMDNDGRVQYAAKCVAADLGYRNFRRITDRIGEARKTGFLDLVAGAAHGRVAIYRAAFPSDPITRSLGDPASGSLSGLQTGSPGNGVTRRGDARDGVTKEPRDGVTSITIASHVARPQRAATRNARGCDVCEDYGCAACIPDASEAS